MSRRQLRAIRVMSRRPLLAAHGQEPRGLVMRVATGSLGAAMVILPALGMPGQDLALTAAALVLVVASLIAPLAGWRWTGGLAAFAAVLQSVLAQPGTAVMAVQGLLILGYLTLLDAPRELPGPAGGRWLRQQAPAMAWGAAASASVLAALMVSVPVSAWLVVAGMAAAVAATAIAFSRLTANRRKP